MKIKILVEKKNNQINQKEYVTYKPTRSEPRYNMRRKKMHFDIAFERDGDMGRKKSPAQICLDMIYIVSRQISKYI